MIAPGDRRSRPLVLLLFAFAVVGVLLAIGWVAVGLGGIVLSDVHAYYDAAARLNAGQPLYDQAATTNESAFYRYPPLLAIAFRPLAALLHQHAGSWVPVFSVAITLDIGTALLALFVLKPMRARMLSK